MVNTLSIIYKWLIFAASMLMSLICFAMFFVMPTLGNTARELIYLLIFLAVAISTLAFAIYILKKPYYAFYFLIKNAG